MGFDVMHLNLHKTFATPHGGGGLVRDRCCWKTSPTFLPIPTVNFENNRYRWRNVQDRPQSIGRLSTFMGNTGILLRAYVYARLLGREGRKRVSKLPH